jgi:hypothetical protein
MSLDGAVLDLAIRRAFGMLPQAHSVSPVKPKTSNVWSTLKPCQNAPKISLKSILDRYLYSLSRSAEPESNVVVSYGGVRRSMCVPGISLTSCMRRLLQMAE